MVDPDGRPDPQEITTVAAYVDALRRLKDWTGLSYRQPAPGAVDWTATTTTVVLADTTLVRGVPDAANGHDPILSTCGHPCADSSVAGFERRVLLKFDLVTAPAGGCPTAVTLR